MGSLKELVTSLEEEGQDGDGIEILADSVKQALELAAQEFDVDLSLLDYEIVEKGTRGFFGVGRQPYRVLVRAIETDGEFDNIEKLESKLSSAAAAEIALKNEPKDIKGKFVVRVTKSGIWFSVTKAKGKGKEVEMPSITKKLYSLRITDVDMKKIEKEFNKKSGIPVKIGEWTPNPEFDGTMSVEVAEDEMTAYVHFAPPRFAGRHMELDDVVEGLKHAGVVVGLQEDKINEYLEEMNYNHTLLAAKGELRRNGKDAYIDYKVKVDKTKVTYAEDERGQVDFHDLDLLENVVVGQVLAIKVPQEEGISGRTISNKVIPAKSGRDIQIQYGKNTILSDDGMELTAATNGQVVFKNSKLYVEEVLYIKGDVSLETGNITCLGSVLIAGSVQDNFIVKAAGNIEIKGSVQKALIEAEGDILVRQGIVGRDEAKVESTTGSVFAKFIQRTNIVAEKDVVVSEGVLHSHVDAGGRILCNGKRAKIVGGIIRAGEEVNAKFIGSDSFTKTEVRVGINPKILQQATVLEDMKLKLNEELASINKNVTTLSIQKKNAAGKLPEDKAELLEKMMKQQEKNTKRLEEIHLELDELKEYLNVLEQKGKVCAEGTVFPGVEVYIKDRRFPVKDPYNFIKFSLEGGDIRLSEYEAAGEVGSKKSVVRIRG